MGSVVDTVTSVLGGGRPSAPPPVIIQAPAQAAPAAAPQAAPAAPAATAAAAVPTPEGAPTANQGAGGGGANTSTQRRPGQRRGRFSTVLSDIGGFVERFGD